MQDAPVRRRFGWPGSRSLALASPFGLDYSAMSLFDFSRRQRVGAPNRILLFLCGVAALTACGGPRVGGCLAIGTYVAPYMVYPMSGATTLPDGNFTLVLSSSASPVQLDIGTMTVVTSLSGAPVPSPLPSPAAPGVVLNPAGYSVGSLQPATTYTVVAPAVFSPGCGESSRPPQMRTTGTFTTK